MKLREDHLLFVILLLHHVYIAFLNTSTLHGLYVLDVKLWTAIIILPLTYLGYLQMKNPSESTPIGFLYIAFAINLLGSLLRIGGINPTFTTYTIMLTLAGILVILALGFLSTRRMRVYSVVIILAIAFFLSSSLRIIQVQQLIGPLLELAIVLGILYYNVSFTQRSDEAFVIIIFTYIGWEVGFAIAELDVAPLILQTMLQQTLNLGQYSISGSITPTFFFALHMAEIFNILALQFFKGRSWVAMGLLFTGLDFSYPPLALIRILFLLMFFRKVDGKQPQVVINTDALGGMVEQENYKNEGPPSSK